VVAQKPSKLLLFQKSEYNEDPFNLGTSDPDSPEPSVPKDYQLSKQVDLNVGNLVFLQWTEFDTEPVFVVVSNDKALVVLNQELEEVFRNEEQLGSTDLCFFTSVGLRRDSQNTLQGTSST
jgi:hypothetical protein